MEDVHGDDEVGLLVGQELILLVACMQKTTALVSMSCCRSRLLSVLDTITMCPTCGSLVSCNSLERERLAELQPLSSKTSPFCQSFSV